MCSWVEACLPGLGGLGAASPAAVVIKPLFIGDPYCVQGLDCGRTGRLISLKRKSILGDGLHFRCLNLGGKKMGNKGDRFT